jgi:hypothetical protein
MENSCKALATKTNSFPFNPLIKLYRCGDFGKDTSTVDKVQASWGSAEHLTSSGRYSEAIAQLNSTARFLPMIHGAFIRGAWLKA